MKSDLVVSSLCDCLMSSSPPHLTFDKTLGALLVGFAVACVLWGVLNTQIIMYFTQFKSDRPMYKLLVILIWILDTVGQTFVGHLVYYYIITNFAAPFVLLRGTVTWSFILQLTLGAIVGAIVKTCFALRVWRFSENNKWITGIILLLTYGQLSLAILYTVKAFGLPGIFAVSQLRVLGTIALSVSVLTDIVIAGALCYFLRKLRTGFERSDSLVYSLCRYAINTGVVTSAVSISTLVLYNVEAHSFIFVATYFALNKMYAISLMATLNTRRIVRGRGTDRQQPTISQNIDNPINTNTFYLGTRVPSVGSITDIGDFDLEHLKFAPPECPIPPSQRESPVWHAM